MNRFILPVMIAAGIHGLIFGIPGGSAPVSSPVKPPAPESDRPTLEWKELPEVTEEADEVERVDEKVPFVPPTIPDAPTIASAKDFTIPPVVHHERVAMGPVYQIPTGYMPGESGRRPASDIVNVASLDGLPKARSQMPPQYPYEARSDGRNGEVTVEFVVNEAGRVTDAHVVSSTDRVFESAALAAVSKWRFEPGKRFGRPVKFRMALPIIFTLND